MQSIKFEQFDVQAGQDNTGVPTGMATVNATVKLRYRNRGTFFGTHVTSTPLALAFQELILASGTVSQSLMLNLICKGLLFTFN